MLDEKLLLFYRTNCESQEEFENNPVTEEEIARFFFLVSETIKDLPEDGEHMVR